MVVWTARRVTHAHVYEITTARSQDLPLLPPIELAAARLLAGHAPDSVLADITSQADLEQARRQGHLCRQRTNDLSCGGLGKTGAV